MGDGQHLMKRLALIVSAVLLGTAALAQDVRITTFKNDSQFTLNGRTFTITRNQDAAATLNGDFARTSRACPPHCIQPMTLEDGVTVGIGLRMPRAASTTCWRQATRQKISFIIGAACRHGCMWALLFTSQPTQANAQRHIT